MRTDAQILEIAILNRHGVIARPEGEGTDRALDAAIPRTVAEAVVSDLAASGCESTWALDHDDQGMAWVYIMSSDELSDEDMSSSEDE